MTKYYFTFGSDPGFPYQYGWVEIDAPNEASAREIFRAYYPDRSNGCLNCSFVYPEEVFVKTPMYRGEYWDMCHAKIQYIEC